MALRISGGDWTPWANVAHQLVSERQGQQSLDLRADALRAQREQAQASNYLRQLGLEQNQRQFDATQEFKEEQLGERYFRDALQAEQRASELGFRMEEAGFKRGLNETDRAIRMGAVYDTTKKQWRPITQEDELWDAHQEYVKNKRTNVNQNVELNRRITFIDRKINNNEKLLGDLNNELLVASTLKKPTGEIEARIKKVNEELVNDRRTYNDLYKRFFQGFAPPVPAPTNVDPGFAPASAAGEVANFGQGVVEDALPPRTTPSIAPQGAGQIPFGSGTEDSGVGGSSAAVEGDFSQRTLEAMSKPDTIIEGKPFFVAAKHKQRVKTELIKLLAAMQKAQRERNFKKLAELNKLRKNYFKKNRKYLTQNPDRS